MRAQLWHTGMVAMSHAGSSFPGWDGARVPCIVNSKPLDHQGSPLGVVLICSSLMVSDVGHLVTCLKAVCVSCVVLIIAVHMLPQSPLQCHSLYPDPGAQVPPEFPRGPRSSRPSGSGAGPAGDREEREELPLQPGRGAAAAGRRRAIPPAERHGLRPHGEDLPCDLQVRTGDEVHPGHVQRGMLAI